MTKTEAIKQGYKPYVEFFKEHPNYEHIKQLWGDLWSKTGRDGDVVIVDMKS